MREMSGNRPGSAGQAPHDGEWHDFSDISRFVGCGRGRMEGVVTGQTFCRNAVSSGIGTAADPPSRGRSTSGLIYLQGDAPFPVGLRSGSSLGGNFLTNDAGFQFADLDRTLQINQGSSQPARTGHFPPVAFHPSFPDSWGNFPKSF